MHIFCAVAITWLYIGLSFIYAADAPKLPDAKIVAEEIATGDAAKIDAAVAEIHRQMGLEPATASYHMSTWAAALVKVKHFTEAGDLCMEAIGNIPDDMFVMEGLSRIRVECLLAAGKNEEALSAAKSYYNISTMSGTVTALQLLSKALDAAHPKEPGVSRKFRLEQVEGAATQPGRANQKNLFDFTSRAAY